jgi:hypothetical protein
VALTRFARAFARIGRSETILVPPSWRLAAKLSRTSQFLRRSVHGSRTAQGRRAYNYSGATVWPSAFLFIARQRPGLPLSLFNTQPIIARSTLRRHPFGATNSGSSSIAAPAIWLFYSLPSAVRCPENVGSRFLPLLQSVPIQPISIKIQVCKKSRFRAVLRARLGVPNPERYANSLSERRTLSGAWGLSDLVYKLFVAYFQAVSQWVHGFCCKVRILIVYCCGSCVPGNCRLDLELATHAVPRGARAVLENILGRCPLRAYPCRSRELRRSPKAVVRTGRGAKRPIGVGS